MAKILSRAAFKDYCLRRLGFPVIQINVDDDQVEDRIDDALQYWSDYHFDGTQKTYYVYRLTEQDITRKYIDLHQEVVIDAEGNQVDIIGVNRVFPISETASTGTNMFDLRYQLRLNELYDFTSASYVNYSMTMSHLRSLEQMFTGETPIRYSRHMNRLYIDWGWGSSVKAGDVMVAECYSTINPEVYTEAWNDRWLKEYATALIKRSWAQNLKKFGGIQLPGGVTLNGTELYSEATSDIERLEQEVIDNFGGVLEFYMN